MMRLLRGLATVALLLAHPAAGLDVYRDALAGGWQDWSWGGVTRDLARSTPVHTGSASVAVTYTGGWSGLQLGRNDAVDVSGLDVLRCWVHGGASGGQAVQVEVGNHLTGAATRRTISPQAGTWTQVDVPLIDLGTTQVTYVFWFNNSAGAQPVFYVDDVAFLASGNPTPTPAGPVAGPALHVEASAGRHPISADIYGMNFADEALAAELRLPVSRWGGNGTTRYNWQTDTSNHASDWFFENIPNDNPNPGLLPDGSSSDRFVEQNRRTGTATLLTVPLIGWTPRGRAYACGFGVGKYGAQQSTDPWRPDCGNGVRANNTEITGNDPLDTSDPIAPAFVQDWIRHLIDRYGSAAAGGVRFYNLDNEPMLWADTHRDVHPAPPSYDELRDRTLAYAAAIKAVDPTALTLGPAEWGWSGYFWSALDAAPGGAWWNNPQDRLAHGNVALVEWYLQQLRAYDQQHGARILDYLDLHYYPQAAGVALAPAGDTATQARRLRSTRSLWDPNYTDESWIGEAVQLVPRMADWTQRNYPGTKLAIGEYNWGAHEHINGALAQADVLGIFGREAVDLATLWDPPTTSEPAAFAFRMYRNVDGAGGSFGDVGVDATSTDQGVVSIYAAQRGANGPLAVMVLNKADLPQTSTVTLSAFAPSSSALAYRYSAANLSAIVRLADQAMSPTGFTATFPPASITLFVIGSAAAPATLTPTASPTPPPTAPASATRTATATRTASATASRTTTATPSVSAPGTPTRTRTATATAPLGPTHQIAGVIRYYRGAQPVPGATVEAQGSAPLAATSGVEGQYTLAGIAPGNWRVAPRKTGDAGSGRSALDAAYVLQAVAGSRLLDAEQRLAGDVSGDGTLSALDATRILQLVVGAIPELPAKALCRSDWLFLPNPSSAPNQSMVEPAFGPGACEPGAIAFSPLDGDAAGQDFRALLIGDVTGNWSVPPP